MTRFVSGLARGTALTGGLVLSALILMTCISIAGRALSGAGLGPVPGDFELVEAGIAFCIFAFLPFCQLKAGHATVDVFTSGLSDRANRWLLAFWELPMAAVAMLIAWRLALGGQGKMANGEITFLLQFPVWWAYAACLIPAVVGVVVALWSAWDRLRAAATGQDSRPIGGEGAH